MKILFLSLSQIRDIEECGIYTDLLRQFVRNGHDVRIVSPVPGMPSQDVPRDGYRLLRVQIPPMQKVSFIRKGIASLLFGPIIRSALQRYCHDERYDLILVATPPITIAGTVEWLKRRDGARVYLLLKDIWPQAIADLGAISQTGPIYRYYRSREKKLYALADRIGCMSPANVSYLLRHNPELDSGQVEVCPNSIEPKQGEAVSPAERRVLREKIRHSSGQNRISLRRQPGAPTGHPIFDRVPAPVRWNGKRLFCDLRRGHGISKAEGVYGCGTTSKCFAAERPAQRRI